MSEVACNVLDMFFRHLRSEGRPPELLAEGTGFTVAHLTDKHERIPWAAFIRFMQNATREISEQQLVALGTNAFSAPALRAFAVVARLMFTPTEFLRWIFEKERGLGDRTFSCIENALEELSPGDLLLQVRIRDGFAPCREFFLVTEGVFRGMSKVLGVGESAVTATVAADARSATFHVRVPTERGLPGRAWRAVTFPFTARAASQELKEAHETLLTRFRELEQMRRALDEKAHQLTLVNEIGHRLARTRSIDELGAEVTGLLVHFVGCGGAALWLTRAGEPPRRLHVDGDTRGDPERHPLHSGDVVLGQLDAWALQPSQRSLFDALVPWIALALQNAATFSALAEHQSRLEQKVAERTRELNEALEKQKALDRQRTEFFANASHELRTPLTLMLAPLESLQGNAALPEPAREEIRSATRAAYRLLKLVNDLLDLSKLEAGRLILRMGSVELRQLLEDSLRPFRPSLQRRGVEVRLEAPERMRLVADAERLEQVFMNLLSNAAKHTPDGGRIVLRAHVSGERCVVEVENTGEGIDAADLPRLFDRFAQGLNSRGRRFGSTGLGLPVVRELVELHGGEIRVENSPGSRVVFRVELPLRAEVGSDGEWQQQRAGIIELSQYEAMGHREEGSVSPVITPTGERPVLLVAEDNAELRAFLVRSLSTEYDVLATADGAQALQLARERQPDLVLSDLMMPEVDGAQLCEALKGDPATAGIPFVLLTARGDLSTKLSTLAHGADDYIVKPFHVDEVKARLRTQLRLRQLTRDLAHREKLAALGTVVGGVAHELRNPLNGVLNALEPLQELLNGDESARELLELALTGARKMEVLSSRLLRQLRAGEGVRSEVRIDESLQLALQLLGHKASNGGPRIEAELPTEAARVVADPASLEQIWLNLLDNAIYAAGPGGVVKVSAAHTPEQVVVEVRDSGRGVPPERASRIFDPFFTTKPVGSGTGLGLSIVRELVESLGGSIALRSPPGEGACFRVTLPAAGARMKGPYAG